MNQDLKIYFFGSIWGASSDKEIVSGLLTHLKTKGRVLSEYLFTEEYKTKEQHVRLIHDRNIKWIRESDVMVGDVSAPSLGIGYELREGVIRQEPILCLYKHQDGKKLSAMIDGSPGIIVERYHSLEEAKSLIDTFFKKNLMA